MSRQAHLWVTKIQMSYGTATLSSGRKSGGFQYGVFYCYDSKLHLREWSTMLSAKVIELFEGIRFVPVAMNEEFLKQFTFIFMRIQTYSFM